MHELRTQNPVPEAEPALLLCTVGGKHQPILKTIQECRPQKVFFLPSVASRITVENEILPGLVPLGCGLSAGQYEIHPVPDADDIGGCVTAFREHEAAVQKWLARGPQFRVLVDITAGTKCMAAALALVAHRWRCTFLYVGGKQRNDQGIGTVVSGFEQVVIRANPWDSLGYQAIEDAIMLFDGGNYAAAEALLQRSRNSIDDPCARYEMEIFQNLVRLYDAWDHFGHKRANDLLQNVQKNFNDLQAVLPWAGPVLKKSLHEHAAILKNLLGAEPGLHWVHDLMANARRKSEEHRYADAVARLYRAIEALAQSRLRQQYGLDTAALPLPSLPSPLREEWAGDAREGVLQIGLQKGYHLLRVLGDPLGHRFQQDDLDNPRSPLKARNDSVLAHGFQPVSEKTWQALWKATLHLTEVQEKMLVRFPRLSRSREHDVPAQAGRQEYTQKPSGAETAGS